MGRTVKRWLGCQAHISWDVPVRSLLHNCLPPAAACPSVVGQLLDAHSESVDLVGPKEYNAGLLFNRQKVAYRNKETGNKTGKR